MKITEDTKLKDITETSDILDALTILAGAAIEDGNRPLYEHIARARKQYESGVDLHLTDGPDPVVPKM